MGQRPCNRNKFVVGYTTSGMAVPAFRGAEDPPTGDQNQQGHQQYQQQQPYQPPADPNAGQPPADPNAQAQTGTVSLEEYEALKSRMSAADRNKSQMEQKLKEFEDRDKTELEKAQRDAQEALARAEKAEKELQESHIEREFLKLPGFDWHDAGDALRLLDRDGVEIGDDGTVKGVKEAAQKLAKAKPFMLKATQSGGDGKDGQAGGKNTGEEGSPGASTGTNPGPPSDANNRNSDRERLAKKFPALGRR